MLEPGQIFAQRYRVNRRIAEGGMGAIFEAEHTATERRVALREYVRTLRTELAQIPFDTLGQEGRIDYVLLGSRAWQVTRAALCMTDPEDGIYPSDHYGVVAEIKPTPLP